MKIPVTPGRDDGGIDARRVIKLEASVMVGPEREWSYLTVLDLNRWWDLVGRIFESELEDRGVIRPAFRNGVGSFLLEENSN